MTQPKKIIQALHFMKDVYSEEEARFWCIKEHFSTRMPRHSLHYWKYFQYSSDLFLSDGWTSSYLDEGVRAVSGVPKPGTFKTMQNRYRRN